MSSAEGMPEGRKRDSRSDHSATGRGADDGLPLLDRILEQTLRWAGAPPAAEGGPGRPQVAEELEALVQVARRYPDQAFTVQPILEELIEAILDPQLGAMSLSPAARQTMVAELARTLYDDDASRERLAAFWNALLERKP